MPPVTAFAATAAESVTVERRVAEPSATFDVGPVMLSFRRVLVVRVVGGSAVVVVQRDGGIELTLRPVTVVVPEMMIVSSPSTTASSVGVNSSLPDPLSRVGGYGDAPQAPCSPCSPKNLPSPPSVRVTVVSVRHAWWNRPSVGRDGDFGLAVVLAYTGRTDRKRVMSEIAASSSSSIVVVITDALLPIQAGRQDRRRLLDSKSSR